MQYPPNKTVSVLTLARGREAHLRNLVLGLTQQSVQPDELIIGVMQDDVYEDLPSSSFPVRQLKIAGDDLPLARARNTVANAAKGETLIFLDVDCIPNPDLVENYARYATPDAGLIMGDVIYLPADAAKDGWTYVQFDTVGEPHADRPGPPDEGMKPCEDYRCFWSLNFALHRRTWDTSGGFDERFTGYGGEDTDFGRTLAEREIPIQWAHGCRAYHQYHPHCMPPIHHIPAILRNAEVFAQKWGHRTMEHWLTSFRMMGLIEDRDGALVQVREPEEADYVLCRQQEHMPYASSVRVQEQLEKLSAVAAQ